MCVFYAIPFLLWVEYPLFVFEGYGGLSVVDAVSDVHFVGQYFLDLPGRPHIALFFGCVCVDIGERAAFLIVQPAGCGDVFFFQTLGDAESAVSVRCQIEYFLNDPAGVFVGNEFIFVGWIFFVSDGRARRYALPCGELCFERGFYLAAGVLCIPFVEQVFERHEIGKTLFRILPFRDGDVAHVLFGEKEVKIIAHHYMFSPKAGQVFGDDAVHDAVFHIAHHPLKTRAVEVCAGPSIVDVFIDDIETVFLRVRAEKRALRFDADAISIGFIIPAQAHVKSGIVVCHSARPFQIRASFQRNDPRLLYLLHDKYSISAGVNQGLVLCGGFRGVLDDVGEKFVERFPDVGKMFGDPDARVAVNEVLRGGFLFVHLTVYSTKIRHTFYHSGSFGFR